MADARSQVVDVVYVHGVGGPVDTWRHLLPSCVVDVQTVRYHDVTEDHAPRVELADTDARADGAGGFGDRRAELVELVEACARRSDGTDGARRLQPPVLMPASSLLVTRLPLVADAVSYRRSERFRATVTARVAQAMDGRTRPTVLLGHSLGSIVALQAVLRHPMRVALLLTIGSPLGVDRGWQQVVGDPVDFPMARVGGWLNVVNTRDPIPWGRGISSLFPDAVDGFVSEGFPPLGPGGAHDPACYVRSGLVQEAIAWAGGSGRGLPPSQARRDDVARTSSSL